MALRNEHATATTGDYPVRREVHIEVQEEDDAISSQTIPLKRTANVQTEPEAEQPLSKRKRRQLERREQKREWRKTKRREERARKKERRQQQIAQVPSDQSAGRKTRRYNTMATSECKLRVAVDLAHDEHMDEEGLRKTVVQIGHCYATNRRADQPLQFFVVNIRGRTRQIFDKTPSYRMWDVFVVEESLTELWSKEEVVYLSAESDNVLTELDDKNVYVIGGLIDHNSKKGLCLEHAVKNGFRHARLPIPEFVEMKTRKVLSINQVFEILVHFSEHKSWKDALMSAIPKRKGAEPLPRIDVGGEQT